MRYKNTKLKIKIWISQILKLFLKKFYKERKICQLLFTVKVFKEHLRNKIKKMDRERI